MVILTALYTVVPLSVSLTTFQWNVSAGSNSSNNSKLGILVNSYLIHFRFCMVIKYTNRSFSPCIDFSCVSKDIIDACVLVKAVTFHFDISLTPHNFFKGLFFLQT